MHRKVAAALLAALALGAAGCGGSEGEELTRAQLANRIQAACRQAQEQVAENQEAGDEFFAAALGAQRQLVRRLDGLEAPDELSEDLTALVDGLGERTEVIARVAGVPRAEQPRMLRAASVELTTTSRSIENALRTFRVRDC